MKTKTIKSKEEIISHIHKERVEKIKLDLNYCKGKTQELTHELEVMEGLILTSKPNPHRTILRKKELWEALKETPNTAPTKTKTK